MKLYTLKSSCWKVTLTFSLFILIKASSVNAQWFSSCGAGPICTSGTNFNQIENAGSITPTTNRQLTSKTVGGSDVHKVFFTFSATAGRTYVFDLCDMGIDGLTSNRIAIYDGPCSSGSLVAHSGYGDICNSNGYMEWTCPTSGTYYVRPHYGSVCTGNFSLGIVIRMGYYYLDQSSCATATGNYFDAGGNGGSGTSQGHGNGNYFRNIDGIVRTYTPPSGYAYSATFSSFNTQSGTDQLYVYNGNSTAAPQVAGSPFSGNSLPNGGLPITSTAGDGSLTFEFISNSDFTVGAGYLASLTINATPAIAPVISGGTLTCASPTTTLTVTNPAGGTSYSWSGPVTGSGTSLNNATAGNYTLTATDAAGCVATSNYSVSPAPTPPTINISPSPSTVLTCTNTSITLGSSTNAASPSYSWTGAGSGSSSSFNATSPGTYNLMVTDGTNGCTNSTSVVITSNTAAPGASITPPATITCTTPNITLTGSSPTGGVSYAWTGAGTGSSSTLNTSTPGGYTLTVTNPVNGCTSTANVTVNQNTTAPGASITPPATITCTTPNITLTGSSPTGGVSYAWTGAGTGSSSTLNTSTPGGYTLTVTNPVNGCTSTANVTVNQNTTAPGASITPPATITCTTPNITLTGSSPTGGVNYAWTGAGTGSSSTLNTSTPGGYTLTVTNPVNGCTSTANVTVNQNTTTPGASITPPATITCTTPNITLTGSSPTGGVNYAWTGAGTGSSSTLNTSTPGGYTLTVTNPVNGCTSTANVTVNQNTTAPGASITPPATITCTTPNITLTGSSPTGGVSYAWTGAGTGSSSTLNTSTGGSYTLTVTNPVNGCTSTANVTVNQNTTLPGASIDPPAMITCTTPNITLTGSSPTAGVSYAWTGAGTGSSATLNTPAAGNYTLTVTDPSNGCTSIANVTVVQDANLPNVSIDPVQELTCLLTSLDLNGSSTTSGVNFSWTGPENGSSSTLTISTPGNYVLTVTDPSNGCTSTANITVIQNTTAPDVSIDPVSDITCITPIVTLTGNSTTPSATFDWTGPVSASTASMNTSNGGGYTLVVTDPSNGCTSTANITVNENNTVPNVLIDPATDITCSFPTVTLNGNSTTSGVTYSWTEQASGNPAGSTPSSASTDVTTAGDYILEVTDPSNGCTNSAMISINGNVSIPDISVQPASDITCTVTAVDLMGSSTTSGVNYSWTELISGNAAGTTPSNTSTTVSSPGTYILTVTDPSSGCSVQQQVTVSADTTSPAVSIIASSTSIDCSANITATLEETSGTGNVQWNGPSGNISGNPITITEGGVYTVVVTDASNGCTSAENITVASNNAEPVITLTSDQTICPNESATLVASGGGAYLWSTGETSATINVSPSVDQYYTVTITNSFGCIATDSSLVSIYSGAGSLQAVLDTTSTEENLAVTTNVGLNDSGNFGSVSILNGPDNGTATVNGTDITYIPNSGFIGTDTLTYLICDAFCNNYCDTAQLIVRVSKEVIIIVPSGFSPNGDGLNDVWEIIGLYKFPENELWIYNRWGELVYHAQPYENDWSGQSNNDKLKLVGEEVTDGTYFYVLKLTPDDKGMNGYIELRRR